MGRTCKQCKSNMHKARTIESGNATYETWQCDECDYQEEICIGIT